jgi:Cytochrome C oxidase, cbb3-type, subunit III
MKSIKFLIVTAIFACVTLFLPNACKHEPLMNGDGMPIDSTDVMPPNPTDSVDYSGVPCSADTVYFQNQILPLMVSQCAQTNCHDVISAEDGIITTDYAHIRDEVKPYFPTQSKLYKAIIDTDLDDRMPPPPAAGWTVDQKNLLKKWIEQGALNNACNESYGACNTTGITYTNFIKPIIANACLGCHGGNASAGAGIKLNNYAETKASGLTGKFYGSIARNAGFKAMPKGGQQLSPCFVEKVKAWVDGGMIE